MGLKALFEALIPKSIKGKITGRLNTGAKNPAWFAFEAIAPIKVNTVDIPPVTKIKILK